MENLSTMTYEVTNRIARITLNRPTRGNGITMDMPRPCDAISVKASKSEP